MITGKRISRKFFYQGGRRRSVGSETLPVAKTGAPVLGNTARACALRGGEGHS